MASSAWIWVIIGTAGLKDLLALAVFLFGAPLATPDAVRLPLWINAVQTLAFGAAGAFLVLANSRDRRAQSLGGFFLLTASSFADRLLRRFVAPWSLGPLFGAFDGLEVDAFSPLFFWLFVRDFPASPASFRVQRLQAVAIRLAAGAGVFCFGANVLLRAASIAGDPAMQRLLAPFARFGDGMSIYYELLFVIALPALPVALLKTRTAGSVERRRVRLFLAGLALGLVPTTLVVLSHAFVPGFRSWILESGFYLPYILTVEALLLSVPFTTAYAVVVSRVLDVRLVVRQTLRYALARYTVMTAALLPFAALAAYFYDNRGRTLSELFAGSRPILYLAAGGGILALVRLRRRALEAIDRRFFREQYSAQTILSDLVAKIRKADTPRAMADSLTREIDRALHVESIAVLVKPLSTGALRPLAGTARPLEASSALAGLAGGSAAPLDIDLDSAGSPLHRLPEDQKQWLVDGGIQLVVPMHSSDGTLVGLIALGEKKSELPFDAEDRALLGAVAASCGLALENRLLLTPESSRTARLYDSPDSTERLSPEAPDDAASECADCGRVFSVPVDSCEACGGGLEAAAVPFVLPGKFRFERRIGRGGMGVVYRARDLVLGRTVAVKTLPRMSSEHARRLRREARAAAAIVHPNLALIYGAESWRGVPMLVFEFLDGGTLADRLRRGTLPPADVVALGIVLADVLERTHSVGLLHGDIKPSNIGYRDDGTPKLLDFGIARMLGHAAEAVPSITGTADVGITHSGVVLIDSGGFGPAIRGTMPYLSPEAIRGEAADPSFDLWSAALVLFEALTGRNPLAGASVRETLERVRRADLPDARELRTDCPEGLALFLRRALTRQRSKRPSSAREFGDLLRGLASRGSTADVPLERIKAVGDRGQGGGDGS